MAFNGGGDWSALGPDPKSALVCFCQRYTKKPVTKTDIMYNNVKFGNQFQSTVTVACMGGAQFAGEVALKDKEAEQNAAKMALINYAAEIASLTPGKHAGTNKKRKADTLGGVPGGGSGVPVDNAKVQLNSALMRIVKRPMQKEDVTKNTVKVGGGYQCTISMPCLPDQWKTMAWAGEVGANQKIAEENAAKHALAALQSDATFSALLSEPKEKVVKAQKTEKGGKGGGGKGGGGGGGWYGGDGWDDLFGAMMSMMGGGYGGGWKSGPKPREQVSDTPIFGTVDEWKGKFGWIKPASTVEHEMASKNGGRIFLHTKDWKQEAEPTAGQSVQFTLYSDKSGLGAENCSPA